jgi:hypothetical protein
VRCYETIVNFKLSYKKSLNIVEALLPAVVSSLKSNLHVKCLTQYGHRGDPVTSLICKPFATQNKQIWQERVSHRQISAFKYLFCCHFSSLSWIYCTHCHNVDRFLWQDSILSTMLVSHFVFDDTVYMNACYLHILSQPVFSSLIYSLQNIIIRFSHFM